MDDDKKNEEHHQFEKNDILAIIIALYKIMLPQLLIIGLVFFIIAYFLLWVWLK
ncbi:MAG: hypothetical protein KGZ79_16425 [Dethiobacter sp.]|nr:hypothetical protein [Dethiobacter sp.]